MSLSVQNRSTNNKFVIVPTNIDEAMHYAKIIADSTFCPREFKGKTGDVLIAMQMGAEIGLSPMQALQNIAVINGKPTIYGDAALAVVVSHPAYISHREWFEGSIDKGNFTAFCGITRKNSEEYVKSFSMEEAKKAGLWTKQGVWQQYPSRMLQMRARAFCIRDKFADALRGISVREEVEDYNTKPTVVRQISNRPESKRLEVKIIDPVDDNADQMQIDFNDFLESINKCESEDQLKAVFTEIKKANFKSNPELLKKLVDAKDKKKSELIVSDYQKELDSVDVETGEVK